MDAKMEKDFIKGGAFLIEDREAGEIFTPEDFTDEHKMIAETMTEFIDNEVTPLLPDMEKHDWQKARDLVKAAGDLGMLGANIPEDLGGAALDQVSGVIIAEVVGRGGGFGTTFGAQTSIGVLPILYFGSEELKKTWSPKIVSGEVVTAYCLSEAGSGSDALGAKCVAKLSDDGTEYVLNGEKMLMFSSFLQRLTAKKTSFPLLLSKKAKIADREMKNTRWESNLLRRRL